MRSQIVGASPLLSHQQLAHSFLLWRPVQTCKSLCFITLTAPCRHELPHALRKQAGVGRYRMFKDLLEEVSRGGKERKELPQQLGLLSGIMSVDGYGCPRCENQLCFGWKVDLFLPGGRCAGGSRSRASRCTDRCALAASSQRSNNRAASCAAADEPGIPFTLAALGSAGGACRQGVRLPAHGHLAQPQRQFCWRGQ